MKKYVILILLFCFYYTALNSIDSDYYDESNYIKISYKEPIGNLISVGDAINWFRTQIEKVSIITEKDKNYYYVTYCLQEKGKTIGSLEMQYTKEDVCKKMTLQMIINGTRKIYYDDESKRILRMFVSYNDNFDYYIEK